MVTRVSLLVEVSFGLQSVAGGGEAASLRDKSGLTLIFFHKCVLTTSFVWGFVDHLRN